MINYTEIYEQLRKRGMDLDRIIDALGMPIDQGIKPLVAALNFKGYRTTASCEGHPTSMYLARAASNSEFKERFGWKDRILGWDDNFVFTEREFFDGSVQNDCHFNGPWVDLNIDQRQNLKLENVIVKYNEKSDINWVILPLFKNGIKRLQVYPESYPLEKMHESSIRLADEILERE